MLGRGAAFVYVQFFVLSISGYIFWIILSHIIDSILIGTLSTIVAISEILTSFAVIGIPDSIQRLLGKSFSEQRAAESKVYIIIALSFISLGITASSLILIMNNSLFQTNEFNSMLKLVIILVISSSSVNNLLNSIVISSLNTKILATSVIISSVTKITLCIILAFSGNILGLAICYLVVGNVISSILLGNVIIKIFRSIPKAKGKLEPRVNLFNSSKELLIGGIASWVPLMVTTIGFQLGTIIIFGSKGAADAAFYFVSLTIVNGIVLVTTAIFTIALPALSSIEDGRKRFAWETIRWSSLVSIPLSSSIFFYSKEILLFFGQNYIQAELPLQILLLSILPSIIANGIDTLVYSYGNYRKSLAINLGMNVTRILLYFMLIPFYGSIGGALSFTIGSLIGLAVSATIAKKIRMIVFWRSLIPIFIIPMAIGFFLYIFHVNFIIGFPITIIVSYMALLRLGTLTKSDIHDVIDILPDGISNRMIKFLHKWK
jgi:O-antigen/teichoic acid export membrane protein